MALSPFQFMFIRFLVLLSLFYVIFASSFAFAKSLCHDDESSALLKFKESIIIHESAFANPSAYPKVSSWKLESGDCCLWRGVECDENTGHVIKLDLSSSCLYGSINSNNSIFHLVNLQSLILADNNFSYSPIPTGIRQLSKLTYLNLRGSVFSGQIPSEILQLTELVSLDLSFNSLHGEFPTGIFQLPKLQSLNVRSNTYLTGYLPEFNRSSPLVSLTLASTSFSGKLPDSIGNLKSLHGLFASECDFSGPIPTSLANLTELIYLDLSFNNFSRGTLSWLGKQNKLIYLQLVNTNLDGDIPFSIGNLTQLQVLSLPFNNLTGQIPPSLANLTQLIMLRLNDNRLHGPIPQPILSLVNLEILYLNSNYLSGAVEFDFFLKLKNLTSIRLSSNNFSLLTKPSTNATIPKFKVLGLGDCGLSEFPDFLRNQDKLEFLELCDNKIHGQVPKWMGNLGKETLWLLDLSNNFLTGFDQLPPVVLPWTRLRVLKINSNKLQGSLPFPPLSISIYIVSSNLLSGEISPKICNLTSLLALDLSNNNLSSLLPQCLGNLSSLNILKLRNNTFRGPIPQICREGSKLKMIDFSQNQLQGHIPRSLANCTMLEKLDLGNNLINDVFPYWLGVIPELRILNLRYNGLHGAIGKPKSNFEFPKLHVIDLSNNSITGTLPSEYFKIWKAMQIVDVGLLTYVQAITYFEDSGFSCVDRYDYSMTLMHKGTETEYLRIQNFFVVIDLSGNKFEGEIPKIVGNLKGLHTLNLSNNLLYGPIPSSLMNLTQIESLDLSRNKLSGEIPPELVQLNFLEYFNVSHNRLTGAIPHGNQFNTFENSSFDGNAGLCGNPLSKKCGNPKGSRPPPSTIEEDKDSESPFEFGWKAVVIGYGCGFVFGIVIGQIVITRNYDRFMKNFARRVNI